MKPNPTQPNPNQTKNKDTEMEIKITEWIYQSRNEPNCIREDMDIATKGNFKERNWISTHSGSKYHPKDQLCQSEHQ